MDCEVLGTVSVTLLLVVVYGSYAWVSMTVLLLRSFPYNYFYFVLSLYLEKRFENVHLSSDAKGKSRSGAFIDLEAKS